MSNYIVILHDGAQAVLDAAWARETPAGTLEFYIDGEPAAGFAKGDFRRWYQSDFDWEYIPPPEKPPLPAKTRILPVIP
jgi:hypothetical protein